MHAHLTSTEDSQERGPCLACPKKSAGPSIRPQSYYGRGARSSLTELGRKAQVSCCLLRPAPLRSTGGLSPLFPPSTTCSVSHARLDKLAARKKAGRINHHTCVLHFVLVGEGVQKTNTGFFGCHFSFFGQEKACSEAPLSASFCACFHLPVYCATTTIHVTGYLPGSSSRHLSVQTLGGFLRLELKLPTCVRNDEELQMMRRRVLFARRDIQTPAEDGNVSYAYNDSFFLECSEHTSTVYSPRESDVGEGGKFGEENVILDAFLPSQPPSPYLRLHFRILNHPRPACHLT